MDRPVDADPAQQDRTVGELPAGTTRSGPAAPPQTGSTRWQRGRRLGASGAAVAAATLMFLGICLGFLMNTPVLQSPDEVFHYDRIMAAEHGLLLPDPGSFNVSRGSRRAESHYVPQNSTPALQRFAITPAPQRALRESYDDLGGDARSPTIDIPNYISQHPPLYYDLLGGLTWLIPGSDTMHEDQLMWILKVINILIMLPLPLLMYRSARNLVGDNAIARASAFLPLLVPGLARSAAGINNDNLAILIGAALVAFSIRIAQGDLSRRTALWVSLLAVAGSLTKATVLFVLIIVPIAYAIAAVRRRRLPTRPVLAVLAGGAVLTAAWWIRNVVAFGAFQPNGYGASLGVALGAPWPPGQHDGITVYLDTVRDTVPSRFWGALGLLEPPALPQLMIWTLTAAAAVCAVVAVVVLRRRRVIMAAAVLTPLLAIAMFCFQGYRHWLHYQNIPGLQGRYAYPAVFGIVFGFALVAALVLGRHRRFAPVLIAAVGTLVTGWGLFTSVEYFWLPQGTRLRPTSLVKALRQLFSWSAFGPVGTASVLLVAGLCFVAGVVLLVLAVRRDTGRGSLHELLHPRERPAVAAPSTPADVPAGAVDTRVNTGVDTGPGTRRTRVRPTGRAVPVQ